MAELLRGSSWPGCSTWRTQRCCCTVREGESARRDTGKVHSREKYSLRNFPSKTQGILQMFYIFLLKLTACMLLSWCDSEAWLVSCKAVQQASPSLVTASARQAVLCCWRPEGLLSASFWGSLALCHVWCPSCCVLSAKLPPTSGILDALCSCWYYWRWLKPETWCNVWSSCTERAPHKAQSRRKLRYT